MEIKLERVTKLVIIDNAFIALDFDDNHRVIYTQAELKTKINNLIGGFETIKRMLDQSQSQSQSQSGSAIVNILSQLSKLKLDNTTKLDKIITDVQRLNIIIKQQDK